MDLSSIHIETKNKLAPGSHRDQESLAEKLVALPRQNHSHSHQHPLFLDAPSVAESLESGHETRKLAKPHKMVSPEELGYEDPASAVKDSSSLLVLRKPMLRRCSTGNVKRMRERLQSGQAVSQIHHNKHKPPKAALERDDSVRLHKQHYIANELLLMDESSGRMDDSSGNNSSNNNNGQSRRGRNKNAAPAPAPRRKPRRMSGYQASDNMEEAIDRQRRSEFLQRENSVYLTQRRLSSRRASMTF